MCESTTAFFFFNRALTQTPDWNYEQSIIVPLDLNTDQPLISPFLNDHQLLPGQSRITHIIFKRTNAKPTTCPHPIKPPTPCNSTELFQIDHKIHYGFTSGEEILIKNALQIVASRLFKPEILQNMYDICGTSGQFLGARVWSRSQLRYDQNYHGTHDLLRFQLMCLKMKSENGQFPTIHIYPTYEKTNIEAEGTVGCISCMSRGSTFSIEGIFEVKLNRYQLDMSDGNIPNALYWAGVIVHEMLHNLGHKHKDDDYTDSWQINVFEKCFVHNGNYSSKNG